MANKKLLSQFRKVLKQNGLKYTYQRVDVLEEIVKDKGHRDCEDIYLALKQKCILAGNYYSFVGFVVVLHIF